MKQIISTILIVFNLALSRPVFAQDNARILPPNPFYFLKEWQRGIKVALSGPRKAEAILDVLDDKAVDFVSTGSNKVLNSYKESEKQLGVRISDIAQDSELLDRLFDHALRNYFIFDIHFLAKIFSAGGGSAFGRQADRFALAVKNQDNLLRELIAAELLESIEADQPLRLKEDLLITLLGKLAADESLLEVIKNMSGDTLRRIKVLDQARESVSDSDFKTKLNHLRQQILLASLANINESVAQTAIGYAAVLTAGRDIERAEFNLAQAEQLLARGNYAAAFGQASLAEAVVKNAMLKAAYDKESFAEEVAGAKEHYQSLAARLSANGGKDNAEAKKLLDEAQKLVNRLSKFGSINVSLLNNLKIILATLENL